VQKENFLEKRGHRFFVKKRHVRLQQSKVQVKTQICLSDFSLFLSLSLTFSLSLSFTTLFVVLLLFVSSERARCAVEADTINERFYSRTFSVIIDDEIIWKKKKKKL